MWCEKQMWKKKARNAVSVDQNKASKIPPKFPHQFPHPVLGTVWVAKIKKKGNEWSVVVGGGGGAGKEAGSGPAEGGMGESVGKGLGVCRKRR